MPIAFCLFKSSVSITAGRGSYCRIVVPLVHTLSLYVAYEGLAARTHQTQKLVGGLAQDFSTPFSSRAIESFLKYKKVVPLARYSIE